MILNYLSYELYQILRVFVDNNKYFLLKQWEKNGKTYVSPLFFFWKIKKIIISLKQELTFFNYLKIYESIDVCFHVVYHFLKFQHKSFIIVGKPPEKL